MSIDFKLTAQKEIRYQAELFRILDNVKSDVGFHQFTYPSIQGIGLVLDRILLEATILDDESKLIGEADLILVGKDKQGNKHPLLVIEVKKRIQSSLTKPFQNGFRQAWKYALPIGCKFCAVYDGHFMITMQKSYPYLVGMCEFSIDSDQNDKSEFARNLWEESIILSKREAKEPIENLCGLINYPRWERTIRYLIRDAYKRFYNGNPSTEEVEEIAAIWDKRYL